MSITITGYIKSEVCITYPAWVTFFYICKGINKRKETNKETSTPVHNNLEYFKQYRFLKKKSCAEKNSEKRKEKKDRKEEIRFWTNKLTEYIDFFLFENE